MYISNKARDDVYNLGAEAIIAADQFLDIQIEAKDALGIINILILDNRDKFEAYRKYSREYLPILTQMSELSRLLLGERGRLGFASHEEVYEEVLETRNNLAALINQPIREN